MKRKQGIILTLILFCSAVLGMPAFWFYKADRQERLNQQLIASIKHEDFRSALAALNNGADANVRDVAGISGGQRLWDLWKDYHRQAFPAATPLLLFLQSHDKISLDGHVITGPYKKDNPGIVNALLAKGAYVNVCDEYGHVPLELAFFGRKNTSARLLVEHGADVRYRRGHANYLILAIGNNLDASTLDLMVKEGADVNQSDGYGRTPLGEALRGGNPVTIGCLLRHHADPNKTTTDDPETNDPLEFAKKRHLTEIARLLREAGAKR